VGEHRHEKGQARLEIPLSGDVRIRHGMVEIDSRHGIFQTRPNEPPSCTRGVVCVGFTMNDRLQIVPDICHGKPVIRGTRVLVATVLGALAGGDSMETILEDYPNISRVDVQAALEFASRLSDYEESSYDAVA